MARADPELHLRRQRPRSQGVPRQTGNIGVYAAGYYPQVRQRLPALAADAGRRCLRRDRRHSLHRDPQAYDPPTNVVATDNQRPVSAAYPYYIGTSGDFYDPGYRAGHAYASLESSVAERVSIGRHDRRACRTT